MSEYVPRLSIPLPKDLLERYHKVVPWGNRAKVIKASLKITLDYAEKEGWIGLAKIIDGQVCLKEKEKPNE